MEILGLKKDHCPNGASPQIPERMPDDRTAYGQSGDGVALSGSTAVVDAWYDDDRGEDSGSADVFAVGPDADGDGTGDG